ncbi:Alcohol dehydrogenase zinc-binding domain protein [Pseudodesulfovibrio profundus]|uniref:Alcohol dehydrogenase zinc-binding domain protein n=2 Tax=Pseudodesulfovibrio profundus TaxID=57320 RepID=A0A2C8FC82_9BACT|nr:Alcohol dehydrogenase zinc-binding domain protein [Pseudodesulfovibrio profundus]
MQAMMLRSFGDQYDFDLREVSVPTPKPGEVLIRVVGSSFNPIDNKIATLGSALGFAPELPAILGMDVSGVVVEAGCGFSRFQPGDAIYGCAGGLGNIPGALAEYMVVDERLMARAPENMELADAASLPLVSITAWLGLFAKAGIAPGETLLVQGGAGGVGHIATQLGVYAGAEVHATVSSDTKSMIVESLGAIPVNYRETDLVEYTQEVTDGDGFDVIYDTVGGANLDVSFPLAGIGGSVVTTVSRSTNDLSPLHAKSLSLHVVFMLLPLMTGQGRWQYGDILREITSLIEADELAVLLDESRFHFTEISQAHRYWATGEAMGKIVIDYSE